MIFPFIFSNNLLENYAALYQRLMQDESYTGEKAPLTDIRFIVMALKNKCLSTEPLYWDTAIRFV